MIIISENIAFLLRVNGSNQQLLVNSTLTGTKDLKIFIKNLKLANRFWGFEWIKIYDPVKQRFIKSSLKRFLEVFDFDTELTELLK